MTHSKMKTLTSALLNVIGKGAALTVLTAPFAFAQTPPATDKKPETQKVEKIQVLGTNIKRVDAETVAPVQIITREDIERTGKDTIAEVLRDIPSNSGGSFNETFTNSFSPGSSGISLRGLGQKATLVLINGRRTANYGFAQNLQDTFVDLNSIPAAAVERIEILRDGASAIYGADAVGGVVNIIFRKDFRGVELAVRGGTGNESGMNEYRTSIAGGVGDLARDRFNVFAVADYYHRDLLLASERDWTRSGDFTNFPGGALAGFSSGVGTIQGNIVNGFGQRVALSPCPTGSMQRPIQDFDGRRTGTVCARNTREFQTLFPKTDRFGFVTRGQFDFSSSLSAFGELAYSKNKSEQTFTAAFAPTTQVDQATGLTITTNIVLPATHPNNPIGGNRILQYAFYELGGRDSKIDTDATRGLAGLKGVAGSWDWEVAAGAARSETEQINYNRVNRLLLTQAFVNAYDFSRPNPAVANALRITPTRVATSKLTFVDAKASSELYQLPAGPLGFAAGVEYRRETLQDRPDALITSGAVLGQGGTSTDGSRNSNAIFAELSVPVVKDVEVQLAARRDDYSDFGNRVSPKVGIKWAPTKELLLRATSSRGFRAPTLPEVTPSRATFFVGVQDPLNGGAFVTIAGTVASNPNIKPETSQSNTVGLVFEPTKDFNVGLDYYKIKLSNTVQIPVQFAVNRAAAGDPVYIPQVIRNDQGVLLAVSTQYFNLDFQETSGFDIDANYAMKAFDGRLSFNANLTYVASFKQVDGPGGPVTDIVDQNSDLLVGASYPRYRGSLTSTFSKGDWSTSLTYRYVNSLDQVSAGTPLRAGATPPSARVSSNYEFDLFAAYTGIKNLRLTGSVRNLLNRRPPFDPAYSTGIDFSLYDARGRFYNLGATYSFK